MALCFKIAQLALERAHPSFPILCCLAREQDVSPDKRVPAAIAHGTDWIERYPCIAAAALKNRQKHFVVEGEEVVLGVDDVSDFDALHSLPGSFNFPRLRWIFSKIRWLWASRSSRSSSRRRYSRRHRICRCLTPPNPTEAGRDLDQAQLRFQHEDEKLLPRF